MKIIDYLSLLLIHEMDNLGHHSSESEVYLHGKGTGIIVPAQYLEAAILLNDGRYLLFTVDNIPYDEALDILLIKIDEGIQEQVTLSTTYGSGAFRHMALHDNSVEFSYFSDEIWRVEVSKKKFFKLPFECGFLVTRHPMRLGYFIHISLFR